MDVGLLLHKAKKRCSEKPEEVPVWRNPDGDISCSSLVRCADFRCIKAGKKSSRSSSFSVPTVEQVCSAVVTPRPVTLQKQLLRRKKKHVGGKKKVILPRVLCDVWLLWVCRIRRDKKTIGFLVVGLVFCFFFYLLT